jgi:hypothetical protein
VLEASGEISNGRRRPVLLLISYRIGPAVDLPLEAFGFLARCGY